jgi:hypothetical protein
VALTVTLGWAAAAHASAFSQTFDDYRAHGKVNACKFSAHQLKQAKSQIPPDIEQYAPDFPAALDAALQARARGTCGGANGSGSSGAGASNAAGGVAGAAGGSGGGAPPSAGGASTAAPGGTPSPGPTVSSPPDVRIRNASHATHGSSGIPVPLLVIAGLAALLAIPALLWALVHWRGWQPAWWPEFRHSLAEASWRAGNGWSEFSDWLRFGH